MSYVRCPNCGTTLTPGLDAEPPAACPDCCARLALDAALAGNSALVRSEPDPAPTFDGVVANDRAAPAAARRAFELFCTGLDRDVATTGALLLSEVVTNAVRHGPATGTSTIALHFATAGGVLQVEVSDDGPGFDHSPSQPAFDSESGWGLHIVEALSGAWGVDGGRPTRVWFDLPLEQSTATIAD
jgi:anti-sigma regulatory factor (Ser/Thr protein kinase)